MGRKSVPSPAPEPGVEPGPAYPIRVVQFSAAGEPWDWGVVVRAFTPRGKVVYEVWWHDGHGASLDSWTWRMDETHDRKRPVTISRKRPEVERAFQWCLAALLADSPVCACCSQAAQDRPGERKPAPPASSKRKRRKAASAGA